MSQERRQYRLGMVHGNERRGRRRWDRGKYGMSLRSFAGGEGRVAYFYGPWLLGAAAADNAAYFNELTADNAGAG